MAQEFLGTHRELGIHLSIMMLEVRAGKRLREALQAFADRVDIEEARSLSVLFKQSEELGASITQLKGHTYAQVVSALTTSRKSAADFASVASLPASVRKRRRELDHR